MFKILLADSDKNNRKRIRDYITASKLDFRVVKEADDGKQAFEALEKSEIDLIICELRLPILSGYHLFKKVLYSRPNTKVIIYCNYDEYQHVQKAQQEGLLDYIFKPVKQQELEQSLIQAKQVLEDQMKKSESEKLVQEEYRHLLPLFKDRFLINLIHGHLENESFIENSLYNFGIKLSRGYTVMIVKIDHYDKLSLVFDESEKEIFIFRLATKIQEALEQKGNGVAFINNYDELSIILGGGLNAAEAAALAEELRQLAKLETVTTVTIGIGRMQESSSDINTSYRQAKAALRHNFYIGANSVIHIDYVEPENKITYKYPIKKEELIVYEAVIGNRQKAVKLAQELQSSLEAFEALPERLIHKILLNIVVSISRYATEQEVNLEELLSKHFSVRDLMQKASLKEAFSYFIDILVHICDYVEQQRSKKGNELFSNAKRLVEERYFENLNLSKAAIKLQVPFSYLDKQFKEKEGVSFMEYFNKYRLNKAKELLLETSLSDEEIALKVGYRDGKYFEYIFMQNEGISTFDFRNVNKGSKYLGKVNSPYV
ncbi:MAG: response regulator [Bacillota bacterium]